MPGRGALSLQEWLAKAERELAAARRALSEGDPETAAARLYYAMFHAAIAALTHEGKNITVKSAHGVVIGQFGLHLCKTGLISEDLGRAFNKAYELRCESDYSSVDTKDDRVRSRPILAFDRMSTSGTTVDHRVRAERW